MAAAAPRTPALCLSYTFAAAVGNQDAGLNVASLAGCKAKGAFRVSVCMKVATSAAPRLSFTPPGGCEAKERCGAHNA